MIFGEVAIGQAAGTLLAHSLKAEGLRLAKGHVLTEADVAAIAAAGIDRVIVARLEDGDLMEDEAASAIAAAISPENMRFSPATTGRINLFATVNGLFCADRALIDALNRIDPAITLACLADHADVTAGDMVATIKIIPLAVAGARVAEAAALLSLHPPFAVKPYHARSVGLVATMLPSLKPSVMDKTRALLNQRLASSGSRIDREMRVPHKTADVAACLRAMRDDHQMLIVFGASAVTDPNDVIPAAIRMAGGVVERVGLPVDPGNLLVLGHIGDLPVIGAPGCARSPKENAFDWVLNRILAGEVPSEAELTGMGVGGLLMEIPTRPRPRLGGTDVPERLKIATIVLAAGQARRMGPSGKHKLLALFDGQPLVRKSTETALAAGADWVLVVTGHRGEEIAAALAGLDVMLVDNPDYASGMASSLKAGLAVVRDEADGILVLLADMPGLSVSDLEQMQAAFRNEGGQAIIRAVADGKRGNPVILPRATFSAISRLEGDIGARPVIEKSGLPIIDVELGPAAHLDTDTPEAILAAGGVLGD